MKKIPTLFERKWDGNRQVIPGPARLDLAGAVATIKWDGTPVLVRAGKLLRRRELKRGQPTPPDFELLEEDEETGKRFGWVPVGDGPEEKHHRVPPIPGEDGTYELVGPPVQGNPHGLPALTFVRHGADVVADVPATFADLRDYFAAHEIEGIVWWRDGAPIAKIKRRDFGFPWPAPKASCA